MSKIKTALVVVTVAGASAGIVGTGAAASFTDSASASQRITTGTLNVVLTGTDADGNAFGPTKSVALGGIDGQNSSFTKSVHVNVTESGSLTANNLTFKVTKSAGDSDTLAGLIDVTLHTPAGDVTATLAQLEAVGAQSIPGVSLANGASFPVDVTYSATDLPNAAMGKSVNPVFTVSAES